MIATVSIDPIHLAELQSSGISDDLIEVAGIRSISDADAYDLGFRTTSGSMRGMLFPYWDVQAGAFSDRFFRLKPDVEIDGRKYLQPVSETNRLYTIPGTQLASLQDTSRPILIPEGEKKALSVETWRRRTGSNHLVIGIGGVYNWLRKVRGLQPNGRLGKVASAPIPDLDLIRWTGRHIVLCLDGDVDTNGEVMWAEVKLVRELRRRGAHVSVLRIPPSTDGTRRGADDVLAQDGDAGWIDLLAQATPHEGRPLPTAHASVYSYGEGVFRIGPAGYEKKDADEETWNPVTNFIVQIEENIQVLDDGQRVLRGHLLVAGHAPAQFHCRAQDLADTRQFRALLYSASLGLEYPTRLSGLVPMLAQRLGTPPRQKHGVRAVGHHDGRFIFPSCVIEKGVIRDNTDFEILNDDDHVQRYDLVPISVRDLATAAQLVLDEVLAVHVRPVMLSLLGCVGLAPVQDTLQSTKFVVYLGGQTGAGKTLIARIAANFFAEYPITAGLPSVTWTINALEFTGYHLSGLIYVVDDLKRQWLEKHQPDFIRLVQCTYDRRGRGRLDRSGTKRHQEYYVRGLLILTGEDFPEGVSSSNERTLQFTVPRSGLPEDSLSRAHRIHARSGELRGLMAHYLAWVQRRGAAGQIQLWSGSNDLPADPRIRPFCQQVLTGLQLLFRFFEEECGVDSNRLDGLFEEAIDGVAAIASATRHEANDQRDDVIFLETVRELISSGVCIVTGLSPSDAGKTGIVIGVLKNNIVYLLPSLCVAEVNKRRGITLNTTSLGRALKERGALARLGKGGHTQVRKRIGESNPRTFAINRDVLFPEEEES